MLIRLKCIEYTLEKTEGAIKNGQDTGRRQEEHEDNKGATRIRISKKKRQHNGQKKKYKRTNSDLQSIHIKLKIE